MKAIHTIFLIFTLFFLICKSSIAQIEPSTKAVTGFYIKSSNHFTNFHSFNEVLSENGYNALENNLFSFSMGISNRKESSNNFGTATITYYETSSPTETTTQKTAELNIIELGLQMQRVLSNSKKWQIYPYLGFGLSLARLKMSKKIESLTFSESINEIHIIEKFEKMYMTPTPIVYSNFGLGLDRRIALKGHALYFGLNIGYKLTSKTNWGYPSAITVGFSGIEVSVTSRIEIDFSKPIF
jgi:hypothetical protein